MNRRLCSIIALSVITLVAVEGCQSANPCCRKPILQRPVFPRLRARLNPAPPPPPPVVGAPIGVPPPPVAAAVPAAPVPTNIPPEPAPAYAPPPPTPPGSSYPPAPNYSNYNNNPPPTGSQSYSPDRSKWTPSPNQPSLKFQEPPRATLSKPEPASPSDKPRIRLERPTTPAPQQPTNTSPLPVGIPNFVAAPDDGVSAGLKPSVEGYDWLRQNRYRTVLHVLAPGEFDSADRKLAERNGLHYDSITLSPLTLARSVDEFNQLVDAKLLHPLFMYDRDGSLVGSLWYLRFRAQGDSDDVARAKAVPLGLQTSPTGEAKTLWIAMQKYLSDRKR